MKCQSCGNEAIIENKRVLRNASGAEATVKLELSRLGGKMYTDVCDACASGLRRVGWTLPTISPKTKVVAQVRRRLEPVVIESPARCAGCRWRTPMRFGGEGILCLRKDGECPEWAIKWALYYKKNGHGKPIKSFVDDEALLEALRL